MLTIEYKVLNSMDKDNKKKFNSELECAGKILYSRKKTKVKCYNYGDKKDFKEYRKIITNKKKEFKILDEYWSIKSVNRLAINDGFKFF